MRRVNLSSANLHKLASALKAGKVLVLPTDTVYGLVADAANEQAAEKVFKIKGREAGKPMPIFVKDSAMAKEYAEVSSWQEGYLERVWPGRVTCVLKSKNKLPAALGTQETIGLRVPDHPLIQELLEEVEGPLTGTSANLAGRRPAASGAAAEEEFRQAAEQPDILVDAGEIPFSVPSRVVDITQGLERVLRP